MTIPTNDVIKRSDAVISLRPNSGFTMTENVIVDWRDKDNAQPSESEIDAELTRIRAKYDNDKYQRDRLAEYPRFSEQFDKIFHSGIDAWKADIQAIKDKYPKP
tara:strand:+ start:468 stop:779 length:312 start_codon:yes stop_codon:yes gene_type:complete